MNEYKERSDVFLDNLDQVYYYIFPIFSMRFPKMKTWIVDCPVATELRAIDIFKTHSVTGKL